ncbi:multidrug effflux MFS transporter [Brachybacterium sp. NBEC-018]|uniref:multidrug effflux MFS transporter n=1 Tax=Brachybacterium sp. NBEC-018 TaxID=2996004 RepID=UPI002175623F|nr:multidrug effflux MFS transporter [Brachybacterium sp. NBEC-018]UVY83628.1 multidrug effflux MFS transporter [Brachybacterium sp. NBEC-018]
MTATSPPGTRATRTDAPTADAIGTTVLLALGLLSAIAPLATDLYLPTFPTMAAELGTSSTVIQLTLTTFLLGLTVGQLVFGPLSDRFGRRVPLVIGSALLVAASLACVLAPDPTVLVAARLVQGFAGAAGMVIGRAMIADLAAGPAAARAFSLMMLVSGVAPVIAPVLGGLLGDRLGWRGLLSLVLALSLIMLLTVLLGTRETLPSARRTRRRERAAGAATTSPLRSRVYLGRTITFACSFAAMMAYISASPFIYQQLMGLGTAAYGAAFGANALALMAVSALSARLAARMDPARLLRIGITALGISVAAGLALCLTGADPRWLMLPILTATAAQGLILGNATALALASVPQGAGTASAVLGALQFGLGALVTPLVSLGDGTGALPMLLVMAVCTLAAAAGGLIARTAPDEAAPPTVRTA